MNKLNNEEFPQAKEELLPSSSFKAVLLGIITGAIIGVIVVVGIAFAIKSLV